MENKNKFVSVIIIIVLLMLALWGISAYRNENAKNPNIDIGGDGTPDSVVCTMDAKICPDGSAVGREGPNCQFAACPAPAGTSTPIIPIPGAATTTVSVKFNQKVEAITLALTPFDILEDSRCPVNVQCIQAGTVRLKARVTSLAGGTRDVEFKLGEKVMLDNSLEVTLTNAQPAPRAGQEISDSDYSFTFVVVPKR